MTHMILLFGGESQEHYVSVASAQHIASVKDSVICWFWALNGQVHEVESAELLAHENPFYADFKTTPKASWPSVEKALDTLAGKKCVVFTGALHGAKGEDGVLQSWLESRQLAFTGSGVKACQITFDKIWAKKLAQEAGAAVMPSIIVTQPEAQLTDFFNTHKKVIIKPVADGSTVGFMVIDSEISLKQGIQQIQSQAHVPYMAEVFIEGTELTIGVIDTKGELLALPCIEMRIDRNRVLDYEGKYLGSGVQEICPAEVPEEVSSRAQDLAIRVHRAFGCDGYSRTDVIVNEDGPVFLETNAYPGLTKASMLPKELGVAGISLLEFVDEQIALAQKKHRVQYGH